MCLCVWVPWTSPLCSSLIIFITAIWMCRAHDECATQVWLAPNRILGYAGSWQQGPRVADNAPRLSVTHTHSHTHRKTRSHTHSIKTSHYCVSESFLLSHFPSHYPSLPINLEFTSPSLHRRHIHWHCQKVINLYVYYRVCSLQRRWTGLHYTERRF